MMGMFLSNIGITIFGTFEGTQAVSGIMYFLSPINSPSEWMWWLTLSGMLHGRFFYVWASI